MADFVVVDDEIDPDHTMLDGCLHKPPHFTLAEVARVFLGRSEGWLRRRREHLSEPSIKLSVDGQAQTGYMRFDLSGVEQTIHNLAGAGEIDADRARVALKVAVNIARQYGHIGYIQ